MEIDMFEHLLKLLVKELLMRCKEVVTSRGVEAEFMDKARESAGKVKEIAQFLQTHGRDELLPQCKRIQIGVATLIRQAAIPSVVSTEIDELLKTVVQEVRILMEGASASSSASASASPLSLMSPSTSFTSLPTSGLESLVSAGSSGGLARPTPSAAATSPPPSRPSPTSRSASPVPTRHAQQQQPQQPQPPQPQPPQGSYAQPASPAAPPSASDPYSLSPRPGQAAPPHSFSPRSNSDDADDALAEIEALERETRRGPSGGDGGDGGGGEGGRSRGGFMEPEIALDDEDDDLELRQLKRQLEALRREKKAVEEEERELLRLRLEHQRLSKELARLSKDASPAESPRRCLGEALLAEPAGGLGDDYQLPDELVRLKEEAVAEAEEMRRRELDVSCCYTCGQSVTSGQSGTLEALGRTWHRACWRCVECKRVLEIGEQFGAEGPRVYCADDYKRKFTCAECGNLLEDEVEENGIGLKKRFFHPDCYVIFLRKEESARLAKRQQRMLQDQEDEPAFRAWMEEFDKITRRTVDFMQPQKQQQQQPPPPLVSSVSAPNLSRVATDASHNPSPTAQQSQSQQVATATSASLDSSTPATRAPASTTPVLPPSVILTSAAAAASSTSSSLSSPHFPIMATGAGPSPVVATPENAAQLLRELGPPPSAKDNPQAYKDYMRRKYELQQLENQAILARVRAQRQQQLQSPSSPLLLASSNHTRPSVATSPAPSSSTTSVISSSSSSSRKESAPAAAATRSKTKDKKEKAREKKELRSTRKLK